MHLVNSGESGTAAFGWPLVLAATVIQWLKSSLSIELPSTVATALPGTPPQPTPTATSTVRAQRARTSRTAFVMREVGGGVTFTGTAAGASRHGWAWLPLRLRHGSGLLPAFPACSA